MEAFSAIIEPVLSLGSVGDDIELSCSTNITSGAGVHGAADVSHIRHEMLQWEASPIILQDGRYELSDDDHMLTISNLKVEDNNTAVLCHITGTYQGQTYERIARGLIRLHSNIGFITESSDGPSTHGIQSADDMIIPKDSVFTPRPFSVVPMLVFLIGVTALAIILILSVIGYRRSSARRSSAEHNLRTLRRDTVSRQNSYQATRMNTIPQHFETVVRDRAKSSTSTAIAPPVRVPSPEFHIAEEDDDTYAVPGDFESNTVPSRKKTKRYKSPMNNKARPDDCHVYGRVANGESSRVYESMGGDTLKRNCVSQPDLEQYQEHRYVNWKDRGRIDNRYSAPMYAPDCLTQINQNANTDTARSGDGQVLRASKGVTDGTRAHDPSPGNELEYAELDLSVSTGVIHGHKEDMDNSVKYARVLRILSVFRTRKSTRVRVTNLQQA